ncbi:MAG: TSUP family transporter [Pseudomonadales bacterium]|nr:TSUP family transporter [Pseudomonadales bacterium]
MSDLSYLQYFLISIIFIWSGFVRSGLGFGGAVLSLPFLLMINNEPIVYLPIIAIHLLVFSSITVFKNNAARFRAHRHASMPDKFPLQQGTAEEGTVNWGYLKKTSGVMIIPMVIGVLGLITLPDYLMSIIIFSIVGFYSVTYILNKPFTSNSKILDNIFLAAGAYITGASLIGAPLIITVFSRHVKITQLRDTLFVLWFVMVAVKMIAFIYAEVDLQLIHQIWLLPCAALGNMFGLRFHDYIIKADTSIFFRVIGLALLTISIIGLVQNLM